jgi:hypothetical protein
MKPAAIKSNAVITSITAKQDGSLGLRVSTPELTSEEKVAVMAIQGINIDLLITPLDSAPAETVEIKGDVNSKSQGQRIRAVLFLLWKQDGEKGLFEEYYHQKTEKYIEYLKGKIV